MGYDLVALLFTLAGGIAILLLPRKWVILPLFLVAFFLTLGQKLVIFGLHFYMTRVLMLFGAARLILRPQMGGDKFKAIDKAMILWAVAGVVSYALLWQTPEALINRLGKAYDALGLYFLARGFIKSFADMERAIKILVIISLGVTVAMLIEKETGRNAFAVFGGVPEITEAREGNLRAQGAFLHPITAGTFGASLFPLFVSLGWGRKHKVLAVLGVAAATIITATSSSSGPVLAYLAGMVGLCAWPLRKRMRAIRWGMLFSAVALHLVMNSPVWGLIGRVKVLPGSTAYHREFLIDQFIQRFGEWWLVGTRSTQGWGPSFLVTTDVTNQYVRVGVDGGLITLLLFILVVGLCFRGVGRARKAFENQPDTERLCWALGASMFAHVVAFMGVAYFDQILVLWYTLLAMISRLASLSEASVASQKQELLKSRFLSAGLARRTPVGAVPNFRH